MVLIVDVIDLVGVVNNQYRITPTFYNNNDDCFGYFLIATTKIFICSGFSFYCVRNYVFSS